MYRIDDGLKETMQEMKLYSGFRISSGDAVVNQFNECQTGTCYAGFPTCNGL